MTNFILRPICENDVVNKLSIGNSSALPLKNFLKKDALSFHISNIAKTYVLVDIDTSSNLVLGYITLMASEIILNDDQKPSDAASKYKTFPAAKIARLLIDNKIRKQGLGGMMLDWAINHIRLAIMPNIGCRFIMVDAKQESITFYEKRGFVFLNSSSNKAETYPVMFLDLIANKVSIQTTNLIEETV